MAFGSWFFFHLFFYCMLSYTYLLFSLHQFFIYLFYLLNYMWTPKIIPDISKARNWYLGWPLWNWCSVNEYVRFSLSRHAVVEENMLVTVIPCFGDNHPRYSMAERLKWVKFSSFSGFKLVFYKPMAHFFFLTLYMRFFWHKHKEFIIHLSRSLLRKKNSQWVKKQVR